MTLTEKTHYELTGTALNKFLMNEIKKDIIKNNMKAYLIIERKRESKSKYYLDFLNKVKNDN